ncbi:MAG: 50S ribosomal protein L18, partial [Clostridia bacterium]|nr:50S ribosomal protein L18 [Clostridia bacterium]
MISKIDKNSERIKRHKRIRNKISGTPERPRLSVFRSTKHIYAQIIDDVNGVTLVAA